MSSLSSLHREPRTATGRVLLVLALLAAPHLASAAPLAAPSTITAVTIYADRAVVTRAARVELPAGQTEITFEKLSPDLDPNSLQVAGRGTAATILDVSTAPIFLDETNDPRAKALRDELTALERQDRLLADKLVAADQQQNLVVKIENAATLPAAGKDASARPSFDDYQKLLAFSAENHARIAADRLALETERAELARKIEAAKARFAVLRPREEKPDAYTATIRVSAERPGPLDLTIDYGVAHAAWGPDYTARLQSEKRQIELTYFGTVLNATGEDWTDIALTLSTAQPSLGAGAPEAQPWILEAGDSPRSESRWNPFASHKPKRPDPSATVLGPDMVLEGCSGGIAPDPGSTLAAYSVAMLDTAVNNASFKIPARATVRTGAAPQKVAITTATLPADLRYRAAPKRLETAFLAAEARNATEFPLLAGKVSTFVDNTFVADGSLKTVMPGERLTLEFGADQSLAVQRKLISKFTETVGLTGKTKRITYDLLITVTNHKRTAERIDLTDSVPVSRDEKVTVKLLAPTERELLKPEDAAAQPPKLGIARDADGKLTWRLDLKPGEKRELPLKFSIEHPADLPVTGVE